MGAVAFLLLPSACMTGQTSPADPGGPSESPSENAHVLPSSEEMRAATLWLTFDDTSLTYDGIREFQDAAEHRFTGWVETADGGEVELTTGPTGRGQAVTFPPTCERALGCGKAMVVVPDSEVLDPGVADFTYGASVKLPSGQTTTGSNLVQKGRFETPGGFWKLQVDTLDGKPSCVVRGTRQKLSVRSPVTVADGRWHRVTCTKDSSGVQIEVDGAARHEAAEVGAVENGFEVRVGSAGLNEGDDQFHGALDDVFLTIEESA